MTTQPSFRRGGKAAKEAAAQKSRFDKIDYFKLEDGESIILRFLTDVDPHWVHADTGQVVYRYDDGVPPDNSGKWIETGGWITCDQHSFVPTKPAPAGYTGNWPKSMGANCRRDPAFNEVYSDCFICDHMKKSDGKPFSRTARVNAYAFVREEIYDNGRLSGYKTKLVERQRTDKDGNPTGDKYMDPVIQHVQMADRNFFANLRGYGDHYGTILDRDFKITRSGSGMNDTSYTFIPCDPVPNPTEETRDQFPNLDLRNPAVAEKFGVGDYCPEDKVSRTTLAELVADRASDEYYGRFFDTRVTVDTKGGGDSGGGAPIEQQEKPSTDVDPERMATLRDRLKAHPEGGSAPEAPSAPEQAQAPEQAPQPVAAATDFDS